MANPNRGMWGPGNQPGGGLNHLQGSTGGGPNSTHDQAFTHLTNVAHQLLTRTAPGSVIPVNINVLQGPTNFNQHYTVWYILDQAVADELRRILAFAPVDIRRVADFFLRPRNQSPYDAVFGAGIRDYSPVVARTTVHARQLLTQRSSYLKAFVIHSRGAVNFTGCSNNCAGAVRGEKLFTAFFGCVSIAGEWNGACSNCVWSDAGARCTFAGSRPAAPAGSSRSANRRSGPSDGRPAVGPSGRPAVGAPDESEERIVDLSE